MALSNIAKHKLGLQFVSDYLDNQGIEYQHSEDGASQHLLVEGVAKKVRVFCNYSRQEQIKVPIDFEPEDDTLYLVVAPTQKNRLGFSCTGGYGDDIQKSFKYFPSQHSLKNIVVSELRFINLKKHLTREGVTD